MLLTDWLYPAQWVEDKQIASADANAKHHQGQSRTFSPKRFGGFTPSKLPEDVTLDPADIALPDAPSAPTEESVVLPGTVAADGLAAAAAFPVTVSSRGEVFVTPYCLESGS